jgi:hypothetical protein
MDTRIKHNGAHIGITFENDETGEVWEAERETPTED